MAMPLLPFVADTTLVASSGNDVPIATIVRPMIAGSTPSDEASSEAALTTTSVGFGYGRHAPSHGGFSRQGGSPDSSK